MGLFSYNPPIGDRIANIGKQIQSALQIFAGNQGSIYAPRDSGTFEADMYDIAQAMANGHIIKQVRYDLVIPSAAASFPTGIVIPAGSRVFAADVLVNTTVVATTAVKIGLGVSGTLNKYALTSALTSSATPYGGYLASAVIPASNDTVLIYACATDGSAAGTLNSGSLSVRLFYSQLPTYS